MWFAGPKANADQNFISARCEVSFTGLLSAKEVKLQAANYSIQSIKLMEGREKRPLTYRLENQQLIIEMPVEIQGRYRVAINYKINLKEKELQNFLQQTPDLLVMNPFNARSNIALGTAGAFYPSLAGDASIMLLNITMKAEKRISYRGTIQFETDNQNGTISQFWRSDAPVAPENFYMVIGEFKDIEAEDLEEELELTSLELRKIKVFNAKKDMLTAIEFLGLKPDALTDSEFAYVDSLSNLSQTGFFITGNEPDLGITAEDLKRARALKLYINQNDTSAVATEVYNLFVATNGKGWEDRLMDYKWQQREILSEEDAGRVLRYRLNRWQSSNPELFAVLTPQEIDTALFEPMLQTFQFPEISISYRYVAGDTALYVRYLQDTTKAPVLTLPVEVTFTTDEGTFKKIKKLTGVSGEAKVKSTRIPNLASVSFGEYFPGRVTEKKPDTYLLYQLGQAKSTTDRREALLGLFKTNNPNLFSTALGIAMRDSDAGLRLLALQNAGELNVPAQQKLRSAIIQLAEDSNAEISRLAKSLESKYYGDK